MTETVVEPSPMRLSVRGARYFQKELCQRYPAEHARVWADIEERYQAIASDVAFARTSSNPMDRRLEFCASFLATIQSLEERGESFESIRAICLAVAREYVRPKNAWDRWLKGLPSKLIRTPLRRVISHFMRTRTGSKGHEDGFLVQIVTDPAETHGLGYGFDIVECGVVKLFQKHEAHQYVPILCEVDELTASLAGLELVRGGTIAAGAPRCDFRFRLLHPKRKN